MEAANIIELALKDTEEQLKGKKAILFDVF